MKTLIIGAGIAGNALAFWLSKLGHDVTIIERFPALRTTGLQIDLRGHGIEVLKRMGLEPAFRAKMAPEEGFEVVGSSGRQWGFFPANRSGKGLQALTTDYEIMRGDFCQLMYDATKDRAKYLFGTTVEAFTDKDGEVEVHFSSGSRDRFHLVVAADGQNSRTRRMMLGSKTDEGFMPLKGSYIGYYTISRPIEEGERYIATGYITTGRRGIMVRRHSPTEMQVYLMCGTESKRLKNAPRGDVEEEKAALAEIFQGAGWKVDQFLEALPGSTNFYCERLGLVKLGEWSRGRVALVGDAAYCPSVMTGMGTSCGIVGAYVLAGEIARHCPSASGGQDGKAAVTEDGVLAALHAYNEKFHPFMEQVQKGISPDRPFGSGMIPTGPIGVAAINCAFGVASFFKLNVLAERFLKEKVIWDLPSYEEMV